MKKFVFLSILILFYLPNSSSVEKIKIAIIGRTFNGALCSFYLRQLIPEIDIDIYDENPIKQKHTILTFHSEFHDHTKQIIAKIGLEHTQKLYPNDEGPLIYDRGNIYYKWNVELLKNNDEIAFKKLSRAISKTYKKFRKIYTIQNEEQRSFTTVNELLKALDPAFSTYTATNVATHLQKIIGKNEKFLDLLKMFPIRSYLQGFDGHAFATYSSFWFSELNGSGFLKRFSSSAYDVIMNLLSPEDNFKHRKVEEIIRENNKNYVLSTGLSKKKNNEKICYDFVIIAEQNIDNSVKFSKFKPIGETKICTHYKTYITELNGSLTNEIADIKNVTDIINVYDFQVIRKLFENSSTSLINSSATWLITAPAKHLEFVHQCHFRRPTKKAKQKEVNIEIPGYPRYWDYNCAEKANFVLGENLYYANAIEWAASNTEMIAIGAKNVALLIYDKIRQI